MPNKEFDISVDTVEKTARAVYDKAVELANQIDIESEQRRRAKGVKKQAHKPLAQGLVLRKITDDHWVVEVDESVTPQARFVIFGSRSMGSRDFLTEAVQIATKEVLG